MRKLVLVCVPCLVLRASAEAAVIHVDFDAISGANDGSSWTDAYTDLQDALAAAASGDEIWVAEGTYKPTDTADRTISFQLVEGVALYGGFAGTETLRAERDPATRVTVLSGDIGAASVNTDNSYHVVVGASNTTLDGFTVTGGNADASSPYDWGGGMSGGSAANCTFAGNSAAKGGGMYGGSAANCVFSNNTATRSGGGMYGGSATDCTFSGNSADSCGGGMCDSYSDSTVTACTFTGNSADYGGGMYGGSRATACTFSNNRAATAGGGILATDPMTVSDCMFASNVAPGGGGMFIWGSSSPTVTGCTFSRNQATSAVPGTTRYKGGGGICSEHSATVERCTFLDNGALSDGGAINVTWTCQFRYPSVRNCAFSGNSAVRGGALSGRCSDVTHCTFSGNTASVEGGAVRGAGPIRNCILWGNSAPTGPEMLLSGSDTVSYSCVQGGWAGTGNIGELAAHDPLFVDAAADDLHLRAGSPCIDAADGNADPATDMEGNARHDDPGMTNVGTGSPAYVDMGAYEFQGTTAAASITVWSPPAGTLLAAGADLEIRWLATGDVLDVNIGLSRDGGANWEVVAASTPNDRSHVWTITDGGEPLPQKDCTIRISDAADGSPGAAAGPLVIFDAVCYVDADAPGPTYDGLTWETAFVHPQDAVDVLSAGGEVRVAQGTYCRQGSDVVVLTMKDGASVCGGYAGYGEADPDGRDIAANMTVLDGQGACYHVVVGASNAVFDGFAVTGGYADGSGMNRCGGGMYSYGAAGLTIANCTFAGNTAWFGGGMYCSGADSLVSNCTFSGNNATLDWSLGYGGGIYGSSTVTNCTFSDNAARTDGGGVYSTGSMTVTNCIFWGNSGGSTPDCCGGVLRFSDIAQVGFADGGGNIGADPLFVDADGADNIAGTLDDDLRLQAGSPCIDAADGDAAPSTDKDVSPRDDDPDTPNTGVGTPPCTDMGAYEFQTGNPWVPPPPASDGGCLPVRQRGAPGQPGTAPLFLLALSALALACGLVRRRKGEGL